MTNDYKFVTNDLHIYRSTMAFYGDSKLISTI